MKVAIAVGYFSETQGGAERAAVDLVRGLRENGIEVDIYARKISENLDLRGAKPIQVPSTNITSAMKHISFAKNLDKMLANKKYDIVHAFTRTLHADIFRVGGGCHKEYLKRISLTRGFLGKLFVKLSLRHHLMMRLEKSSFKMGAYKKIVAVSERTKQEIIGNYNLPPDDIVVIYNGVDTKKFSPENKKHRARVRSIFGIKDTDYLLLFCANGYRTKGLDFALEALALVSKDQVAKLFVVGRGNTAAYRKMVYRLKLKDRIYFLGPRDNVQEIYGAVDVLLHPSLHDPFPNVVLEAMATGIPVITTKVTGTSEIITNNVDSIIIDQAADVFQISEAIKTLSDNTLRSQMSTKALETSLRYTRERNVQANLQLYEKVSRRA